MCPPACRRMRWGKFDIPLEDTGEQLLKNIARPVRVYRVRPSYVATSSQSPLRLPSSPSIPNMVGGFPSRLWRVFGGRRVRVALAIAVEGTDRS